MPSLYDQHMKHWKNHGKDRFVQQCSGSSSFCDYDGTGSGPVKEIDYEENSRTSFKKLLGEAKLKEFPIYIHQDMLDFWHETISSHLFATKIDSIEELEEFGREYVGL